MLVDQAWPGNVREMRNVVEASAAAAGSADVIGVPEVLECLPSGGLDGPVPEQVLSLAQVLTRAERRAILEAIGRVGGNRERAAKLLRISPATLYRIGPPLRHVAETAGAGAQPTPTTTNH